MIDWLHVFYNALRILGCALILAAFSHAQWLAYAQGLRTRQLLETSTFQIPFSFGLFMVSLGLLLLSSHWSERVIWAVFAVLFAWQSWRAWINSRL